MEDFYGCNPYFSNDLSFFCNLVSIISILTFLFTLLLSQKHLLHEKITNPNGDADSQYAVGSRTRSVCVGI